MLIFEAAFFIEPPQKSTTSQAVFWGGAGVTTRSEDELATFTAAELNVLVAIRSVE